jgi:hypothetical protein
MTTGLTFSSTDNSVLASYAGIDQDFLNKINQVVADIRNLKKAHPNVGTVVVHLTSPSGEVFEITVA